MTHTIRCCNIDDVDAALHAAWTELALRATHPNMFAMPQFVLPAARWLAARKPLLLLLERHGRSGRELAGVACLSPHPPTLFAPIAHLRAFRTRHSFQSGFLFADDAADSLAGALFDHCNRRAARWHAIALQNIDVERADFIAMQAQAAQRGGAWHELRRFGRPVLRMRADAPALARVPHAVGKDMRRQRRRLHELGAVGERLLSGADLAADAIERHLDIEHLGWKAAAGNAMRSSAAETGFFREMAENFRKIGNAAFMETLVDGRVVASSSYFLAGNTLNAFKTGYDPVFAARSPGKLNVMALIAQLESRWPALSVFDSNANRNSFMAAILPDRAMVASGFMSTTRLGQHALKAARWLRPLAYRIDQDP